MPIIRKDNKLSKTGIGGSYQPSTLDLDNKKLDKEVNIIKNSDYTANPNEFIWYDNTDNTNTLTLPDNPKDFDYIKILDYTSSFDDNNLTVKGNGNKIQGKDEDLIISDENAFVTLKFYNGDWRVL